MVMRSVHATCKVLAANVQHWELVGLPTISACGMHVRTH